MSRHKNICIRVLTRKLGPRDNSQLRQGDSWMIESYMVNILPGSDTVKYNWKSTRVKKSMND